MNLIEVYLTSYLYYVHHYSTMPKNSDFENVDVTKPLHYSDSTFDFIFIRGMCITLEDSKWDATLAELVRVLKPGGYIECVESYPSMQNTGPKMKRLQLGKFYRLTVIECMYALILEPFKTHSYCFL